MLWRGEQPAGDVQILPLADHGHHAPAVRQPKILPSRLRDEVRIVILPMLEGKVLDHVGPALHGLAL